SRDLDGNRYSEILKNYNQDFQLLLDHTEIHIYMNLCQIYSPNPRQLIRIINKFSLLKENLDNRKKLFLFLFLIYSEMRLIETYKEINFIEHFYELHLNFHQIRFRQYALNRSGE
ncbi:NTPase, partial [Acinetobacter baumannii]|nr:NTPase [Acinetobacter baumannii]